MIHDKYCRKFKWVDIIPCNSDESTQLWPRGAENYSWWMDGPKVWNFENEYHVLQIEIQMKKKINVSKIHIQTSFPDGWIGQNFKLWPYFSAYIDPQDI